MPVYGGERRRGGRFEKCDVCSKFGAKKYVDDKGPDGRGGRRTQTRWMCDKCEQGLRKGK
jgi:hypothetical protein